MIAAIASARLRGNGTSNHSACSEGSERIPPTVTVTTITAAVLSVAPLTVVPPPAIAVVAANLTLPILPRVAPYPFFILNLQNVTLDDQSRWGNA
jgi:hypothetical protein